MKRAQMYWFQHLKLAVTSSHWLWCQSYWLWCTSSLLMSSSSFLFSEKTPPWSEEECKNFEHALQMYDKNFHLIQKHKVSRVLEIASAEQAKVFDLTRRNPYFNVTLLLRSQHERSPNAWRFTTCGKSRSALTSLCSRIGSGRRSTAATLAWRKQSLFTLLSWVQRTWCRD